MIIKIIKPKGQKFAIGQRVRIADDLGYSMQHFIKSANATVIDTYEGRHGGGYPDGLQEYVLDIDGHGESAWYEEDQLQCLEEYLQGLSK